jgi:hypothetical protein
MQAFNRLLGLAIFAFIVAGCGNDVQSKLSCNSDSDCRTADRLGTLFQDGGDPALLPVCCASICALPAGGCESGYRYLTGGGDSPGYGDCIGDPMCPFVMPPDMSMPATD